MSVATTKIKMTNHPTIGLSMFIERTLPKKSGISDELKKQFMEL